MPLNRIDPSAKSPSRTRRNWERTIKGAVASTFATTSPITINGSGVFVLAVDATGGLYTGVGPLKIKAGGVTGSMLLSGLTLPFFKLSEAANLMMGTVTLAGGTATVNNTLVAAATRIFLTVVTPGGTQGFLNAGTRVNGTSFTITSTSVTETSIVAYLLLTPA